MPGGRNNVCELIIPTVAYGPYAADDEAALVNLCAQRLLFDLLPCLLLPPLVVSVSAMVNKGRLGLSLAAFVWVVGKPCEVHHEWSEWESFLNRVWLRQMTQHSQCHCCRLARMHNLHNRANAETMQHATFTMQQHSGQHLRDGSCSFGACRLFG